MTVDALRIPRVRVSARVAFAARFTAVGLSGVLVNELLFVFLAETLRAPLILAAILATQGSTTWNFVGNERWAFAGRRFAGSPWMRYLGYSGMNNASLLLRVPMLWVLTAMAIGPAAANLATLVALFVIRFAVSDGVIWRTKAEGVNPVLEQARRTGLYRYDIAGLIRLDSQAELPELSYFLADVSTPPDITIGIRPIGPRPGVRVNLRRDGERVSYREHLGVLGANFNIKLGTPIQVECSPLLALSRHVLYTNVIEALLRFVLVSKGYVLLHSAGMDVHGNATLLSAQTDTGKTSTVIKLVRERGYKFISDDMTIVDPRGFARTFPKPMTLSYHTMVRAVDAGSLRPKQWAQLQVQSRVHSKSGRSVGKGLGQLNVPIMSINSVVQIMVPPPKYHITSLFGAEIAPEARIANVFLMERGEPLQERVELDAAVDQLIENTDDAYGFPPFATRAPRLEIAGADYQALRRRERELLTSALRGVTIYRLRVRGHEWGELLPGLMETTAVVAPEPADVVAIAIEPDARVAIPIEPAEPVAIPIDPGQPVAIPIEPDVAQVPLHAQIVAEHDRDLQGGQFDQAQLEIASYHAETGTDVDVRDRLTQRPAPRPFGN